MTTRAKQKTWLQKKVFTKLHAAVFGKTNSHFGWSGCHVPSLLCARLSSPSLSLPLSLSGLHPDLSVFENVLLLYLTLSFLVCWVLTGGDIFTVQQILSVIDIYFSRNYVITTVLKHRITINNSNNFVSSSLPYGCYSQCSSDLCMVLVVRV